MKTLLALMLMGLLALSGCSSTETPVMMQNESMAAASSQVPREEGEGQGSHNDRSNPGDDSGAAVGGGAWTGGRGARGGSLAIGDEEPKPEAIMKANCLKLRAAVLEFAGHSGGRYPKDLDSDKSIEGKNVLDYMPGNRELWNPYRRAWAAPVMHTADEPGEIGYIVIDELRSYDGRGVPLEPGYVITGFGEWLVEVAISNLDLSLVDAVVISNCRTLQMAVEQWSAHNGGMYPANVDCDVTPDGRTVIDFLPHDCLMQNPATGALSEPVNGPAACPGQSGLVPVCMDGWNTGYTISGVGSEYGECIICIVYSPEHMQ